MLYLYIYVLVYLCIRIFVFACLTRGNIIFDILEQSSFQKYATCWVFLALRHMLYLCICVFCICIFVIAQFKKNGQVMECSLGHQQHLSLLPALNAVAPLPAVIIVDLLEVSMCSPLSVLTRQPDVEAGVVPPTSSESLL